MTRFVSLLLLVVLTLPFPIQAQDKADEMRINLNKLEESIRQQEDMLALGAGKERTLFEELQRLDAALDDQRSQLEELQGQQREKHKLIAVKESELFLLTEQHQKLQEHLVKRMQSYYMLGRTGLFNALFSSESISELVRSNEAFRSLVTYNRVVFLRFRKNMEEIAAIRQALAQEQAQLDQLITDANNKEKLLQLAVEEQKQFLQQVQTERALYGQAIREMNKSQRDLTAILNRLAGDEQKRRTQAFTKNKGKLPPPINGPLVRGFMEPGSTADAAPFARGITIGVNAEQEVRAVHGGVVIYADYMPGYGKMVIIEHAQQYFTVTAKFAKIKVGEKIRVAQGDVLGTTDSFATLVGKGLYFEIRHGAIAENPMDWLKPDAITRP